MIELLKETQEKLVMRKKAKLDVDDEEVEDDVDMEGEEKAEEPNHLIT